MLICQPISAALSYTYQLQYSGLYKALYPLFLKDDRESCPAESRLWMSVSPAGRSLGLAHACFPFYFSKFCLISPASAPSKAVQGQGNKDQLSASNTCCQTQLQPQSGLAAHRWLTQVNAIIKQLFQCYKLFPVFLAHAPTDWLLQ